MIVYKTKEELMRDREFIGLYDKEEADRIEKKAMERYGEKRGLEKGQESERKKVIASMLKHNMDISQIATIMNLKQSEVSKYLET